MELSPTTCQTSPRVISYVEMMDSRRAKLSFSQKAFTPKDTTICSQIRIYTPSATLQCLLIGAFLLCSTTSATAANPVQIGMSSAFSNSPILSRWGLARSARERSHKQQSLRTVLPVGNDNGDDDDEDDDDSKVQSAFWQASTPAEVYQSRYIEFPVSRQSSNQDKEPESELEYLESHIYGNSILASCTTKKCMPVTALAHAASRSSAVRGPSSGKASTLLTNRLKERKDSEDPKKAPGTFTTHHPQVVDDIRGGVTPRPLFFWESMICGAISRSVAQTIMHPANTMKTILQSQRGTNVADLLRPVAFRRLTYGAGANFLLSVPTGAVNFAVLEFVRHRMDEFVQSTPFLASRREKLGAGLDFMSSAISTVACSVVATPQMMITDNIMAGNYPNLFKATQGLYNNQGVAAFYRGWLPGLVGKIPSYALTWTLFQQLKQARNRISDRPAKNWENSVMGCLASGITVSIMIPIDTIKTRLVTQTGIAAAGNIPYKGIIDCAVRVAKEEGLVAFYRGLPPRLVSVVPMIGIQFGVYEAMKKVMMRRECVTASTRKQIANQKKLAAAAAAKAAEAAEEIKQDFEDVIMQVGASHGNPILAPHMHDYKELSLDVKEKGKKVDKKKVKGRN